ncbi:MAG: hypothetical protein A2V62_00235 [Nitrospirae bacterium RBG_19FT_COMBO_58_9]|nr:MAG: hypothetical protein A2V62_00235 [Nitrospirae bacterium RBG_19FT_COMBO_58_9]
MAMNRWSYIIVLGAGLLSAGCNPEGSSEQEGLGRGIVQGTLGAQPDTDARFAAPAYASMLQGQVTAVEGGAYVVREIGGSDRRVAHDENTRIDRPAHVGDRIEVFVDDGGRAVLIRNIDQGGRSE